MKSDQELLSQYNSLCEERIKLVASRRLLTTDKEQEHWVQEFRALNKKIHEVAVQIPFNEFLIP